MLKTIRISRGGQEPPRENVFATGRFRLFTVVIFLLAFQALQAQDHHLYWKYKDYDGAIAVSLPRWAMGFGSLFLNKKEDRKLLRKVHKVRALIFQDQNPISDKDLKKFMTRAGRSGLDELVTVRSGKTRVNILAKERNNAIRKVVVFFSSEDGSGIVTMKGKFRFDDLNKAIHQVEEKTKKKNAKPVVPDAAKIPVLRV